MCQVWRVITRAKNFRVNTWSHVLELHVQVTHCRLTNEYCGSRRQEMELSSRTRLGRWTNGWCSWCDVWEKKRMITKWQMSNRNDVLDLVKLLVWTSRSRRSTSTIDRRHFGREIQSSLWDMYSTQSERPCTSFIISTRTHVWTVGVSKTDIVTSVDLRCFVFDVYLVFSIRWNWTERDTDDDTIYMECYYTFCRRYFHTGNWTSFLDRVFTWKDEVLVSYSVFFWFLRLRLRSELLYCSRRVIDSDYLHIYIHPFKVIDSSSSRGLFAYSSSFLRVSFNSKYSELFFASSVAVVEIQSESSLRHVLQFFLKIVFYTASLRVLSVVWMESVDYSVTYSNTCGIAVDWIIDQR